MDVDRGAHRCRRRRPIAVARIAPIPVPVPILVPIRVEAVGSVPLRAPVHRIVDMELPLVVLVVRVVAVVPVLPAWVARAIATLTPFIAAVAVPAMAVVARPVVAGPVVAPAVVSPPVVAPAVISPPVEADEVVTVLVVSAEVVVVPTAWVVAVELVPGRVVVAQVVQVGRHRGVDGLRPIGHRGIWNTGRGRDVVVGRAVSPRGRGRAGQCHSVLLRGSRVGGRWRRRRGGQGCEL